MPLPESKQLEITSKAKNALLDTLLALDRRDRLGHFIDYLRPEEIILLLASNKIIPTILLAYSERFSIPWSVYQHYQSQNKNPLVTARQDFLSYQGIRDYFSIEAIKQNYAGAVNFDFTRITKIMRSMSVTHYLYYCPNPLASDQKNNKFWTLMVQSVSQHHQHHHKKYCRKIFDTFMRSQEHRFYSFNHIPKAITDRIGYGHLQPLNDFFDVSKRNTVVDFKYLTTLFKEKTAIVVSFDSMAVKPSSGCLYNVFQSKQKTGFYFPKEEAPLQLTDSSSEAKETEKTLHYVSERLAAEVLHYAHAEPSHLLNFLLDPNAHPCYGTLQFFNAIQPTSLYGGSFIVLTPAMKAKSTAVYGVPLRELRDSGDKFLPTRLDSSLWPLLSQLPESLLTKCLSSKQEKDLPVINLQEIVYRPGYGMFDKYIEVQMPSQVSWKDPKQVKHVHFSFNKNLPRLEELTELMRSGITVSIGQNPFQNPNFAKSSHENKSDDFLRKTLIAHIEQVALRIAEATEGYLKIHYDGKALQFELNITRNNHYLHQAQAAALLYLLGVHDYFKKTSALDLKCESLPLRYTLPLNGTARKEGGLQDHDAYTSDVVSLSKLLNHLLQRMFAVYLVSKQNDEYRRKHNKPHPVTGVGATEEINQTRELVLSIEENFRYEIKVYWFYDRVTLEVCGRECEVQFVANTLKELFPGELNQANHLFHINLPLALVLSRFVQYSFPYQASIIYEDQLIANQGDLLLALALRGGYVSPGGHNDPYAKFGPLTEPEFGELIPNWKLIEERMRDIGSSIWPNTRYVSLPVSCFQQLKEEADEFVVGSLARFPIYRLGRLEEKEVAEVKKIFLAAKKAVKDDYDALFGTALPLSPYPFLDVYLNHCKEKISKAIAQQFLMLEAVDVKICKNRRQVIFGGVGYERAEENFGNIEIWGEKIVLDRLKHYFDSLSPPILSRLDKSEHKSEWSLCLNSTNPEVVLQKLESMEQNLLKGEPELARYLLNKITTFDWARLKEIDMLHFLRHFSWLIDEKFVFSEANGLNSDLVISTIEYFLSHEKEAETRTGYSLEIKELLIKFIDATIHHKWEFGQSLLHRAAGCSVSVVKYLVEEKKLPVDVQDDEGNLPIHTACMRGNLALVTYYLEKNPQSLFKRNVKQQSMWYLAAKGKHWDLLVFLVEFEKKSKVEEKSSPDLEAILRSEADINNGNFSVLHLILACPHKEMRQVILNHLIAKFKMIINLPSKRGGIICNAIRKNCEDVIPILIAAGADIQQGNIEADSPLEYAIHTRKTEAVKHLLNAKAPVNIREHKEGQTPLHQCLRLGYHAVTQLLLQHNACLFIPDRNYVTPYTLIKKMLKQPGVDLSPEQLFEYQQVIHVHKESATKHHAIPPLLTPFSDHNSITTPATPQPCFVSPLKKQAECSGDSMIRERILFNLREAALFITEAFYKNLQVNFNDSDNTLQFVLYITPEQFNLRPYQAAALLYVLGVCDYFKTHSFIHLKPEYNKPLKYTLPLTGVARKEGDLKDHDAYTNDVASLSKLLNQFLKRIFAVYLVCRQNEEHLIQHNRIHPITGAGATDSNQHIQELYLSIEENFRYNINVQWSNDSVTLEVCGRECEFQFVLKALNQLFSNRLTYTGNRITLSLPLDQLLNVFKEKMVSFYCAIIYEDKPGAQQGDLLLGLMTNGGYESAPGGHVSDPYASLGSFLKPQMGKLTDDWAFIQSKMVCVGSSSEPNTKYLALPTSCFTTLKTTAEFVEGSLQRFPIYRLGNLTESERAEVKKWFLAGRPHLEQEYDEVFRTALPLEPFDTFNVYLSYCEKRLAEEINKQFLIPDIIKITINSKTEEVYFDGKEYHQPVKDYGQIQITGDSIYLEQLKQYFDSLSPPVGCRLETHLYLSEINPEVLIQHFAKKGDNFVKNNSQLTQAILQKTHAQLTQTGNCSLAAVKFLVEEKQLALDERDKDGNTILHHVCSGGNTALAAYLIAKKPELLHLRNDKQQSVWYFAISNKQWGLLNDLIDGEQQLKCSEQELRAETASNPTHSSLLQLLLYCNDKTLREKFFKYFLDKCKSIINLPDATGGIICNALRTGADDILPLLIQAGADINQGGIDASSPLELAIKLKKMDSVKHLLDAKALVNVREPIHGHTPLHQCVLSGFHTPVNFLLECKASLFIPDRKGVNAFTLIKRQPTADLSTTQRSEYQRIVKDHQGKKQKLSRSEIPRIAKPFFTKHNSVFRTMKKQISKQETQQLKI